MAGLFDLLPYEINFYEILPRVDDISLLILRHVILGNPLPVELSPHQEKNVIRNGLSLTIFFWEKLDKNTICQYAAECGSIDILKYARENALLKEGGSACPWDEYACKYSAKGGFIDVLKYVRENGCPWNKFTCYYVAGSGFLHLLKYAHNNGCPWDEYTCSYAVEGGSLVCLKFLHENKCPWDSSTCSSAAQSGSLECLIYAIENGCP